ncbi:hypothetical protein ACETK8_07600 [Brevundimonas staleyi]|uniref:ABC transporter permease n=1 Tax=Brevundimonas staleyi TaxID=74326 RepID=A0ABW0FP13_9CAUL
MKPSFSFNDALGAPFVMLKRRPLYLFVWGLMMVAVTVAIYALLVPMFAALPFDQADNPAFMDQYMVEMSRFSPAINGMNLLVYLLMLVLWTAAGRSALSPGRGDRFLFLRLGMDELRVAVAILAVFMGWYIALVILILIGVGLAMALWAANEAAAVVVVMIYGLIVFIGSIWALVRVSLIAPASLILKTFAFTQGWALARGQVWKMIGLNLLVWLIYMISVILMYAVVGGILAAGFFGQGLSWPSDVRTVADLEPVFRAMIAPLALTGIPQAMGFGWVMALYAAPNVVAARQLLDGVPAPAPMAEDAPPADTLHIV